MIAQSKGEFRVLDGLRILITGARHQGLTPIEDIFTQPEIYLVLYRHGLYTIEDLVAFGEKVYQLEGFGAFSCIPFVSVLSAFGLTISDYEAVLSQFTRREEKILSIKKQF